MSTRVLPRGLASFVLIIILEGLGAPGASAHPAGPRAAWTNGKSMSAARAWHTATTLNDGTVLVTGGLRDGVALDTAEIYNPSKGSWSTVTSMTVPRYEHTATLLSDGRVLIAGGDDGVTGSVKSAEIYDPITQTFKATAGAMLSARARHVAISLSGGKVLIAGGESTNYSALADAEIYDEGTETFMATAPMATARWGHAITALADGKVMVAGGSGDGDPDDPSLTNSIEIYDPSKSLWESAPGMNVARAELTATSLDGGAALVAGGSRLDAPSEYRDADGAWHAKGEDMAAPHRRHTATTLADGRVLVAGGVDQSDTPVSEAELFDPDVGIWTSVRSLATPRAAHTASFIKPDTILVAGGLGLKGVTLDSVELYTLEGDFWSLAPQMTSARIDAGAVTLEGGEALYVGGYQFDDSGAKVAMDSCETFNSADTSWSAAASMSTPRYDHFTITKLDDGSVLVTGGRADAASAPLSSAETYNVASDAWEAVGSMGSPRAMHAATLLSDGRVLITGGLAAGSEGEGSAIDTAEIYSPIDHSFVATGSMTVPRALHTATLLSDGRVLVAGGVSDINSVDDTPLDSAELYDPSTETFTTASSMSFVRARHTATLLASGLVLLVGGPLLPNGRGGAESPELYDPTTDQLTRANRNIVARAQHSATLLKSGLVVVAGGALDVLHRNHIEVYDPTNNQWTETIPMRTPRDGHAAALLDDGSVLVAGGSSYAFTDDTTSALGSAELFELRPVGTHCASAGECQSGFCSDEVCCDKACNNGLCDACSAALKKQAGVTGDDGVCETLVVCPNNFACEPSTTACPTQCSSSAQCAAGYACDTTGSCVTTPAVASTNDDTSCALGGFPPSDRSPRWPSALGGLALLSLLWMRRRRR